MSRFSKFLFLLAMAAVLAVVAMVSRQQLRTPREVLDEVLVELQQDAYDSPLLLRQLGSAIRRSEQLDSSLPQVNELCAELRVTRGRLLMEIGANSDARQDFEVVLERYRAGDSEVRRMLVELDSADGELDRALERLSELLADEPNYGPAWVESGRMHQRLADQALSEARERLRYVLISKDASIAEQHLQSLAARAPADPLRTSDILALKEVFPIREEEILSQILEVSELANAELQLARDGYLRSFQFGLYPLAVRGYLEILIAAERADEALHFGSLVVHRSDAGDDPESGRILIATLGEKGDWRHAAELAARWSRRELPLQADFLRLMCHSIYMGRRWNNLFAAANRLRSIGSTDDEALAAFYRGIGYAKIQNPNIDLALRSLQTFTSSRAAEPFEGARAVAWSTIAELYRELGDTNREREAIQAVLAENPAESGELWLRRARIQEDARHSGYQLPLESWARAMSLLPRRTEELLPKFEELGQKALEAQDRDVTLIFDELQRRNVTVPQRDYGPYVELMLARMHGERRNPAAQAAIARRMLGDYPGFLPAHDELISAAKAEGNRRDYVEFVVQRAELAGLDEPTLALLAGITAEEYRPGQVVRMMQADTKGTGRVVVANWLYEHGDTRKALETLRAAGNAERSPHELLLGARIEIQNGNYREALVWLDALPKAGARDRERRIQTLLCALQIGDRERVRDVAGEIFAREAPSAAETLKIADVFLRLGEAAGTLLILDGLDDAAGFERGPVMLRRSLALLAMNDLEGAAEEIDRAEPFLTEVQSTVLRLLYEGRREDWRACEEFADQLLTLAPPDEAELGSLLYLFTGQEDEAQDLADFAIELAPQSLLWNLTSAIARLRQDLPLAIPADFGERGEAQTLRFLGATQDAASDPRGIVPLLLAAELPEFHPYLQARLRSIDTETRGRLWPRLLEAALLVVMDRQGEAEPVLRNLLATFPDCLPAWERLEQAMAERLGSTDHPQVLEIRKQRVRLIARAYPDGPEAILQEGATAMEQGDLGRALRLTSSVLDQRPAWVDAQLQYARLQTAMRNWEDALTAWQWVTLDDDTELGRRAVAGYLDMLEAAHSSTPPGIDRTQYIDELTQLSQRHPDDPRPQLALAELDLSMDATNPAIGVGRALARLRDFREAHSGLALETLQRGATLAWAEFYVTVDPSAAEGFLESELEMQPGDTELWRLLGRVHRDLGDLPGSLDVLMKAGRMTPDPAVQLELARTLVASGADGRTINSALRSARRVTDGRDSVEAQLLLAEATLNQFSADAWSSAVEKLQPLWDSRADIEDAATRARLAVLYARARLLRGQAGDQAAAEKALVSHLSYADPVYQRETMQVLIGVSRSLEPVSE